MFLNKLDVAIRERIESVASTAQRCGEHGIALWATRAAHDAIVLGRLRDKDMKTLNRLEDTFSDDFYNSLGDASPIHA